MPVNASKNINLISAKPMETNLNSNNNNILNNY